MNSVSLEILKTPVQYVKGVGPYYASLLEKMQILTLEDLLYHIPHRYVDRRQVYTIREVVPGPDRVLKGEVVAFGESRMGRRGRKLFQAVFSDESGHVLAKWFNYRLAYMEKQFKKGRKAWLTGKVDLYHGEKQIVHPDLEWWEEEGEEEEMEGGAGILPVYPGTEGLKQKSLRKIVLAALEKALPDLQETLPASILAKYGLLSYPQGLRQVHEPPSDSELTALNEGRSPAHQRMIFDEFFFLELGLALKRQNHLQEEGTSIPTNLEILERFYQSLPFKPTRAQGLAVQEMIRDISKPKPMHRLLQGDVGSGKTVVAAALALICLAAGHQVCLMAPTEILAEQHARTFFQWLKTFEISTTLLKSDLTAAERKDRLQKIARGEIRFVVGTHALIQEDVEFQSLALAVVDEQHRFGVLQRAELKKKGKNPHLLVMTATPIPRTLAMTAYGDLDVSILDELPAGRKPVVTRLVSEKDSDRVFQFVRQEVKKGRQAYIVYPLVEESEALELKNATRMFEKIQQEIFPDLKVGLLHGQLKSEEKSSIICDFLKNTIQILVATTVIEVGVDVPNATVMVIEHAERFGLSQLHQLRGRVGRGGEKSYCVLISGWPRSDTAKERLQVMCDTNDGFKIAEADLKLRGPGDFLGTRQAGIADFRIANLIRDLPLLEKARREAFEWLEKDPSLSTPDSERFRLLLNHRWKNRLGLAQIG